MASMAPTCGSLRAGAMVDGDGAAGQDALIDRAHATVEGPQKNALISRRLTILDAHLATTSFLVVIRALLHLHAFALFLIPPLHARLPVVLDCSDTTVR